MAENALRARGAYLIKTEVTRPPKLLQLEPIQATLGAAKDRSVGFASPPCKLMAVVAHKVQHGFVLVDSEPLREGLTLPL